MTLRRFPWKAPRTTDNSYKLFVSPPNDGPKSITNPNQSASELNPGNHSEQRKSGVHSEPASRHPSNVAGSGSTHHHHHKKDGHSEPTTNEARPGSSNGPAAQAQPAQPQVIKGPWRLLRLLPRESRHIIGRMLEVDPKKRATLEEILEDKWVKNSHVCSQEEGGTILRADNHDHTLVPGSGAGSAPPTQQQPKKV